jgi:tRNA threonylcarbamoyladenosine biosynthesis protein TsaE
VRKPLRFASASSEATEAFGGRLAATLPDLASRPAVVYLGGDLGAGKTTLARGLLHALGVTGTVRSPTYTLTEIYDTPRATVVHVDLYRLRDPAELDALALRELHRPGYLWMVEWPARGIGHLPAPDLQIELTARPEAHEISVAGGSPIGTAWVRRLRR